MHRRIGAKLRRGSLSQGDFWPAETHRDPGGHEPQHELARGTIIIRQVISERDAISPVSCHDPHFKGWRTCRKAVPVHRQPMSLGKVEEHCRIATCGNDPPGRRIRLEPVLFKILLPRHTLHSILSIQDVVCSTVGIEDGRRGRKLLEATSGFLATRAIARGGQNRSADRLQFHLAASAHPGKLFLLFLVHGDRPFVDPVYEIILALVRNIRNGSFPTPNSIQPRYDTAYHTATLKFGATGSKLSARTSPSCARASAARGTRRDSPTSWRAAPAAHDACMSRPHRCSRPRPIAARRSRWGCRPSRTRRRDRAHP